MKKRLIFAYLTMTTTLMVTCESLKCRRYLYEPRLSYFFLIIWLCQATAVSQNSTLSLNGKNGSCVIVNPISNFPTTQVTIEFWMRSSDNSHEGTPISYASTKSHNEFLLYDYGNFEPSIHGSNIHTKISKNDGIWHHVAMTWQSVDGNMELFIDGTAAFSHELSKGQMLTDGGSFVIGQEQDSVGGSFDSGQSFIGEIDEVRIWNFVRTEEEIQIAMHSVLTGKEEGLISYWNFDDGTAKDLTINGNDGEFKGE